MVLVLVTALVGGAAAALFAGGDGDEAASDLTSTTGPTEPTTSTTLVIDPAKRYRATIETSKGTVVALLDPSDPEQSVGGINNFVSLARQGFYDGLIFHRVVDGFMIQGGDPEGTGSGDAGYSFGTDADVPPGITYDVGDLAFANNGPVSSSGSQFFIGAGEAMKTLQDRGRYIKFGTVVEGLDVARAIAALETPDTQQPSETVTMIKITVEEG